MKTIESIKYNYLPDWAQDQIAREIVDDFDEGYNPLDFKDEMISLIEYDPCQAEDLEILTEWLQEKISNEGDPLVEDLDHYHSNLEELITFPILILNGSCVEGRHRLMISLLHHAKIRAYIY